MTAPAFDVVTIGRVSADLYGQQIGGRLEDMASFAKSVGGSPANIAIGAARLGLKAGFISRVGDEAMGRFIREQLGREGVDTTFLKTDPQRLTALVLLGVRDERTFPLIFYRENCADNALDESDIDEAYIASSRAIVVTGTHFARANTDQAQRRAIGIAARNGRKVVLDIDYRPNLWGLAGHGGGEERYIASERVSEHLQGILSTCDLVVGTEEELKIAGGSDDIHSALRKVRELTRGIIVLKRGPMGCVVFDGAIPDDLSRGIVGQGFPVEVYNVLGAGDAFMAGFLSGWLRDMPLDDCARRANACGAIAVSRLLCSPEYATTEELEHFLAKGSSTRALRNDTELAHIHRTTTRRPLKTPQLVLDMAGVLEGAEQLERASALLLDAVMDASSDAPCGLGVVLDERVGTTVLHRATGTGLSLFRKLEPGSSVDMIEWPVTQIVLLDGAASPRDHAAAGEIAHRLGHELAIRVDGTAAIQTLYDAGLRPDWWLARLEANETEATRKLIWCFDPHCRGVLMADDAPASPSALGVVVGHGEIAPLVQQWSRRDIDDRALVYATSAHLRRLAASWTSLDKRSPP
jgi:5-dehydro-2-deoxygluconokinase